ncbi:MAG TPA: class I SAM-dependent methyltransferase, partial [Actinobacteria bacterium]|nr:class I SAM-dependent methyltransferase [Actinomycetota bacterium]
VLDLCTGPGTQALALAERGLDVTATDISAAAVEKALALAAKRGLKVTFLQNDILDNRLDRRFDLILDRGCFHVFPPEQRDKYVETVAGLLDPGGYLLLKCYSYKEKRKEGPFRLHPDEIRERFSAEFDPVSIRESTFKGDRHRKPPIALFCVMRKR